METTFNPFSLVGKTILVTGASSGIGQETAISCARMGARVLVTARDQERLQQTFESLNADVEGHLQFIADLTNEDDVKQLISSLPSLDGAVLCAGNSTTLPLNASAPTMSRHAASGLPSSRRMQKRNTH